MANITNTNTINMSFRVNKNLKTQADKLFKSLGMNTSVALNMFLTQSVREQRLPFQASMNNPVPTKELLEAIQEGEDILDGKIKTKGYHNVKKMFEDIINEDKNY